VSLIDKALLLLAVCAVLFLALLYVLPVYSHVLFYVAGVTVIAFVVLDSINDVYRARTTKETLRRISYSLDAVITLAFLAGAVFASRYEALFYNYFLPAFIALVFLNCAVGLAKAITSKSRLK